LESFLKVKEIDELFVVTNAKFARAFQAWADEVKLSEKQRKIRITVVNDGTMSNETRLGAIADIQFVIDKHQINDDLLVVAGDNIFTFDFTDMVSLMKSANGDVICGFEENDPEKLHRTGVIEMDENQRVIGFEEKPQNPKSNIACPAIYVYRKETLSMIKEYLDSGLNPDAPGHFIPWLIKKVQVYVYIMTTRMYDIGNLESYKSVRASFEDFSEL